MSLIVVIFNCRNFPANASDLNARFSRICRNRNEEESGCVLPEQPAGGHYELGGCDGRCNKRPGDTVPRHSILTYSCRNNYVLRGNNVSVCVNDEWYNPPSCVSEYCLTMVYRSETRLYFSPADPSGELINVAGSINKINAFLESTRAPVIRRRASVVTAKFIVSSCPMFIPAEVCPALSSSSVDISCSYQGETVSCSERILPGTWARLSCKSSYKLPLTNDPAYREITCLDDGLWDRRVFRCLPGERTYLSFPRLPPI